MENKMTHDEIKRKDFEQKVNNRRYATGRTVKTGTFVKILDSYMQDGHAVFWVKYGNGMVAIFLEDEIDNLCL